MTKRKHHKKKQRRKKTGGEPFLVYDKDMLLTDMKTDVEGFEMP